MSRKYLAHMGCLALTLALCACGGGGSSDSGKSVALSPIPVVETDTAPVVTNQNPTAPQETPVIPPIQSAKVTLSGRITFDRVPFEGRNYRGLDYSKTLAQPARGVTVQLVDGSNNAVHSGRTDAEGQYTFAVDANRQLRVRVLAELRGSGSAAWDIQVRDNTSGGAQYVLEGSLVSVGDSDSQTRHLHAASGWTGEAYTETRSAGPFAILDSLYDAVQTVVSADPTVVMPPLAVYWSANNIAIRGDLSQGHVTTSFYTSAGPAIYLLGAANNDSDEYDRGVVQHEFGHYLEHQLGRTESIGGSHSQMSRLDMRVAFGEAWGNAFAGMVSGDPIYRDSLGSGQTLGFAINVENRGFGNQGWFNEASIQAFLYDLFDDQQDASDSLALGFKPIYEILTSARYLAFDGFASVYAFSAELGNQRPDLAQATSEMLGSFGINGSGWYGAGETNDAGAGLTLPVYHAASLGQTLNLCSDSDFQDYNGLDVRRYVRIHLPETRSYSISAARNGGNLTQTNPQLRIFRQGSQVASILNGTPNSENAQRHLSRGDYVFEVYEDSNADGSAMNGGLACFDVRIQ
jgi:hypothetical protein